MFINFIRSSVVTIGCLDVTHYELNFFFSLNIYVSTFPSFTTPTPYKCYWWISAGGMYFMHYNHTLYFTINGVSNRHSVLQYNVDLQLTYAETCNILVTLWGFCREHATLKQLWSAVMVHKWLLSKNWPS